MQELRFAVRVLWRDRIFTLAALITLSLCIGANTALFTIVDHVLLRPLHVPESGRVLLVYNSYPKAGAEHAGAAGPDYVDRLRETTVFEEQTLFNVRDPGIDLDGRVERIHAMQVTPSFFRLVRVPPRLGRGFLNEEGEGGKNNALVLSEGLWQRLFGGRVDAVGRTVRVDGRPFTVVGVMPAEFVFIDAGVQAWVPLALTNEEKAQRHANAWAYLARLTPGATLSQAQAQLDAIAAANLERFPETRQILANTGFHSVAVRLQDDLVRDVRPTLRLLWGGALFVLLIGCLNVVSLVLARSNIRSKEFATRMALGASRWRVVSQLMVEHVALTALAAVGGLLVAFVALRWVGAMYIESVPHGAEVHIDAVSIAFAFGAAIVIGVVLGAAPLGARRFRELTAILRDEGRTGTAGRRARTVRRALVVLEVGVAFVLLIGAGLLLESFRRVLMVDPGFQAGGVLTASVALPRARYPDDGSVRRFTDETLRAMRSSAGVANVGATSSIPLGSSFNQMAIFAEGYEATPGESFVAPYQATVTPGYFEAMGVRLASGRFFDERDRGDSQKVVIVDERLARRFWPNADPIGRRMYSSPDPRNPAAAAADSPWFTVVGVVREIKLRGLVEGVGDVGASYFPQTQSPSRSLTFVLRASGAPQPLAGVARTAIAQTDGQLPVFEIRTMDDRTERSLVNRRAPMVVALSFSAVALFLSAVGIYGVLAYLVTQRRKEIGIRLALGSSAAGVFQLILHEGVWLTATGLMLGAVGVAFLRPTLQAQLFGVYATDPRVLALAIVCLAVVALAACAIPARRATTIDPRSVLSD